MTYLEVLGLAPGASRDEIRDAFLHLIREHHPDASSDPKSARRAAQINAAYSALTKTSIHSRLPVQIRVRSYFAIERAGSTHNSADHAYDSLQIFPMILGAAISALLFGVGMLMTRSSSAGPTRALDVVAPFEIAAQNVNERHTPSLALTTGPERPGVPLGVYDALHIPPRQAEAYSRRCFESDGPRITEYCVAFDMAVIMWHPQLNSRSYFTVEQAARHARPYEATLSDRSRINVRINYIKSGVATALADQVRSAARYD